MAGPKILVVDDNTELLALMAQMLEEAGYSPLPFSRGKPAIEKARLEKPALAIIDVLLPDVMGHEVAAICRKELSIPVIFVTGVFKGGKHALEARSKYDALGYFEKPFKAQELLEAVGKVVKPQKGAEAAARAPAAAAPEIEIDLDIEVDDEVEGSSDPMELTGRINLRDLAGVSATLSGSALTAAPARPSPAPAHKPAAAAAPAPKQSPGAPGSSGELRDNLPQLLTAFYQAQKTGELILTRGKVRKVVYFEHGQPVFALSNVASDRFGQFLVRVGKITDPQLADALAKAKPGKRRTGDVLLELGLLKETEKLYYVGQQVKAIVYSLFGWEEGQYQVSFKDEATAQAIKLDLPPATLIIRGIKKLYKPERLKRLVGPTDQLRPSQDPPYQLSEIALEPWEAQMLTLLDGTRTIGAVIEKVKRPENVVYASAAALSALHIVEK
ncbi:MAG: DUF4388 domain-containing protein [Deltaproteobacteria bacterium]